MPTIYKLTYGGAVVGQDIWSNSLHMVESDGVPEAEKLKTQANIKKIWDAIKYAYVADAGMPQQFTFEYVKLVEVNQAGKYLSEPLEYSEGKVPGQNQSRFPVQLTLAVTLDSGKRLGLAKRGRIFPPGLWVTNLDANGTAAPSIEAYATRFQAFLNALNDVQVLSNTGTDRANVCIYSIPTGVVSKVTEINVGSIVDTQRRRRNRLIEQRVAKVLSDH